MANARQRMHERKAAEAKRKKTLRLIIIGAIALAVIGAATGVYFIYQQVTYVPPATADGTPPHALSTGDGIAVNQASGVPVVEFFSDYQCPGCGSIERTYGEAFEQLANENKIQMIVHTMTFLDDNLRNSDSSDAAIGAACADIGGFYTDYHHAVYQHQPEDELDGFIDGVFRDTIPAELGLSGDTLTKFQQCYDTRATAGFVQQVNERTFASGISGTPIVKVDGIEITSQLSRGSVQVTDLMQFIESVK